MRLWIVPLMATACGRLDFEVRDDGGGARGDGLADGTVVSCVTPIGHDEDFDGVDDACDVCPHIPDPGQLDGDGDKVGNACDPEPANPRQRIALFLTMRPAEQPFGENTVGGAWTQLSDSFAYDGGGFGGLSVDVVAANAVLATGFTVTGQTNGPDVQHQLETYVWDDSGTFTELGFNATGVANVPDAVIAYWDGSTYASYLGMPTASGLHAGAMTITGTYVVGTSVMMDGGWPGEPYHVELVPFASYQGALHARVDSNNIAFSVDWVCVIAW